jgi:hypothetical protein
VVVHKCFKKTTRPIFFNSIIPVITDICAGDFWDSVYSKNYCKSAELKVFLGLQNVFLNNEKFQFSTPCIMNTIYRYSRALKPNPDLLVIIS